MFSYSYDSVWDATLSVLREYDRTVRAIRMRGNKILKSNLHEDKESGFILYTVTRSGFGMQVFQSNGVFIKALQAGATEVTYYAPFVTYETRIGTGGIGAMPLQEVLFGRVESKLREGAGR
jgi:hypothetical protein